MMKRMKNWLKQLAGKKCEGGGYPMLGNNLFMIVVVLILLTVIFKEPIIAVIESLMVGFRIAVSK